MGYELIPVEDQYIVSFGAPWETKVGSIIMPGQRVDGTPYHGTILAAGPGKPGFTGERIKPQFGVGDKILLFKMSHQRRFHRDGEELHVVAPNDVICGLREA